MTNFRKMTVKQLMVMKETCLKTIETNNGPVQLAKLNVEKINKELSKRGY